MAAAQFLPFPPPIPITFSIILFYFASFCARTVWCRYPCLNEGEPVLLGQSGNEFRCDCVAGFFGPFCEYQDTSQTTARGTKSGGGGTKASSPAASSPSSTDSRTWESTFVNLLLCIFFLLILPSIVVYVVRALYLFLKRCHSHFEGAPGDSSARGGNGRAESRQQNNHPTPPPQYWAAMAGEDFPHQQQRMGQQQNCWLGPPPPPPAAPRRPRRERRRRSESPITEVTVQLPASICRPLHGTRSAGPPSLLHQTQSLTLNEFHDLLLSIQREMLAQQQQMERGESQAHPQRHQQPSVAPAPLALIPPELPPPPPPLLLEPPPNYELALNCPLEGGANTSPWRPPPPPSL